MGVISSTTKLCASNLICTVPNKFYIYGKIAKENKTVYCSFLMTHCNYVFMSASYKETDYS